MPKRPVIEYQCDRCPRKWYAPPPAPEEEGAKLSLEFRSIDGDHVAICFETLCDRCATVCSNYVDLIRKVRRTDEVETGEVEEL